MKDLTEILTKIDTERARFYEKGIKSAGTTLRKALQELKLYAQEQRVMVLADQKAMVVKPRGKGKEKVVEPTQPTQPSGSAQPSDDELEEEVPAPSPVKPSTRRKSKKSE